MTRNKTIKLAAAALCSVMLGATVSLAAESDVELLEAEFHHEGIFGSFDRPSVQRGFQVYRTVCAGCHGLKYMAFRNLGAIGYDEDQIKAIAAEYDITDGPNDDGEMYDRAGIPSDHLPSPYPNEKAARASNNGALPPDLSLITKAREDGTHYVYSLLQGYVDPPAEVEVPEGMNYNEYFPGHMIAMAQPLYGDDVEYQDGTEASIRQEAHDLAAFLTWVAEPKLEERKETGLKAILFLVIFSGIFYAYKRKIWADLH
ncbi:MAG: cytochrome c1 [Geminicoccaceae bacterium]|nr:cytochrome c1 [Geminicoccaceae bacterium]